MRAQSCSHGAGELRNRYGMFARVSRYLLDCSSLLRAVGARHGCPQPTLRSACPMMMARKLDWLFVIASTFVIALCLVSIAAMCMAAWSFSQAVTIELPFVATFHGYVEQSGSHAMTVQGSWLGAWVSVLVLTAPLAMLATVYCAKE